MLESMLPEILAAYRSGLFPMADSANAEGFSWYAASLRSLLPLETLHVPRSLRRLLRNNPFTITVDRDFDGVIDGCAARPETWINGDIKRMMAALHRAGYAHSVECRRDGRLAGGLYGMAFGRVFCGESMFSSEPNASKIALVHACARLRDAGFALFDTQFANPHLFQFGLYELPQADYEAALFVHGREESAGSAWDDADAEIDRERVLRYLDGLPRSVDRIVR